MPRKSKAKPPAAPTEWGLVHPHAAGLDIGAREIWAAVPPDSSAEPVQPFGTFTPDLHALADWLSACGVTSVAMESTGVYWIPAFEVLEARGFQVYLVNARHVKNVPGRKSDVLDCQWLQRLHSYGLLNASFRPEADLVALRAYLRQRAMLIAHRAPHIQHMHKALQQMNLVLSQVVSDLTGVTGLSILRAIVAGERDPQVLATYRQPGCRHSPEEIAKALTGHYRREHVFALQQALALYDFYTAQLAECDRELERQYATLPVQFDPDDPAAPLGPDPKANSHSKNQPDFDVRRQLFQLVGVDLVAIDGFNDSTAQTVLAEIGTDMRKWRSAKHFCSWLGLAPHNDVTGGKVVRSKPLKVRNRAGQALRLAAQALARHDGPLGTYYRRQRARAGADHAVTATAHKLARIVYHLLLHRQSYAAAVLATQDEHLTQRRVKSLQRQAAKLGFMLQALPAGG